MIEHTGFHDEKHYSPDCPLCNVVSLIPLWILEYEKEQNDKIEILRKQIQLAKDNDFAEIPHANKFRKVQLDGGQFVYERVLRFIRIARED